MCQMLATYTLCYHKSLQVYGEGTVSPFYSSGYQVSVRLNNSSKDTVRKKTGFKSVSEYLQNCWISHLIASP